MLCEWYLDLEGRCFLDEGLCLFPCCEGDCRRKKANVEAMAYKPSEQETFVHRTPSDVYKALEIKAGDRICTKFIPDEQLNCMVDPYECVGVISDEAVDSLKKEGYVVRHFDYHVIRGVELIGIGTYILAKGSLDT